MPYAARPGSGRYVIGVVGEYPQRLHYNSDLLVLYDARDGNGNDLGDLVYGARDVLPLPNGEALAAYDARIATLSGNSFDPNSLGYFAYGRVLKEWDVSISRFRTAGVEVDLMYVTALPVPDKPAVGDVVVAYVPHLYREREEYAFVRLARPQQADFEHGFYGVVV